MGALLAQEMEELGVSVRQEMKGGVYVEKSIAVGYRICLWSRIANRVLWPLATFPTPDEDALYEGVKAIPWETHLNPTGTLAVDANCVQSSITHSHYTALKTKDAVVDRLRDLSGERPSVDVNDPDVQINTYIFKDTATVHIDLAGQSLYRRGYRTVGLEAPLKENLAAGLLYRAGWPSIAEQGGVLVDPMCGTGTFLIEAALMACKAAPGLLREDCGVHRWLMHEPDTWGALVEEARKMRVRGSRDLVFGSDWDKRSVRTAEQHAKQAGVDGLIQVQERDVREAVPPAGVVTGLLITNPPYGQRMGDERKLAGLYRTLGERLRGYWPGWTAAVFTGNPPLCGELRLKPRRTYEYRNGPIPCRFAVYKLATSDRLKEQASREKGVEMLENRFRRNLRHIGKWARRNGVSSYRLYDGDLPEYQFSVDLYVDVDETRIAHITLNESRDEALLSEARQAAGIASVRRTLELPAEQVIVKARRRQVGDEQYERIERRDAHSTVVEDDAKFLVNLTDFHDTGLFLDNRFVRAYIKKHSKDGRFLNLFAYTGSVTVSAALGGAVSSTTVDLSNTYVDWAKQNFDLNDLDPEAHALVRADCLAWLREAEKGLHGSDRYDLIYLDPPTFSNSKGMDGSFDVQRDHAECISRALTLLTDEGRLIFRCNRRGFRMEFAEDGYFVKDISKRTLAMDFERREGMHHCFEIERQRN
jgi:23S rRNA (guanine2445-N2)-methyltransferase / 23S rRNA (guanine2069-N7)-methyltransferase